jgi:dUTP pyrophosphatase
VDSQIGGAETAVWTLGETVEVKVHQLDPTVPLPRYATHADAGADLYARRGVRLTPAGGRALIPTGLVVALPAGYAGFVQPRSGLALNHGVTCLNTPGLIDSGFRGELSVLLVNTDPSEPYDVSPGDRIAQLVIQRVCHAVFEPVEIDDLPTAERGSGGFGHSGR